MRYTSEHKQATRQRIIEAAGRRFKTDGGRRAGGHRRLRRPLHDPQSVHAKVHSIYAVMIGSSQPRNMRAFWMPCSRISSATFGSDTTRDTCSVPTAIV